MKKISIFFSFLCLVSFLMPSCSTWNQANQTQRGAAIGVGGGAVAGALIGSAAHNTALGTILGAAIGGTAGALIGRRMDKQAAEIHNQIPEAKVRRVAEGIEVEFTSQVLFSFNSYDLTTISRQTLMKLVAILNRYPQTNIEVQGHTDNIGSASYNQVLSEKRATSVADYLIANMIASQRITVKGFGMTVPKYDNSTEEGRAMNRRVEFLITADGQMQNSAKQEAGY